MKRLFEFKYTLPDGTNVDSYMWASSWSRVIKRTNKKLQEQGVNNPHMIVKYQCKRIR